MQYHIDKPSETAVWTYPFRSIAWLAVLVVMLAVVSRVATAGELTIDGSLTVNGSLSVVGGLYIEGESYVVVQATDDAVINGYNLLAAYETASSLTPHGAPLAADNRATVLLPPGRYDLGSQSLELDTEYVDVIGQVPAKLTKRISETKVVNGVSYPYMKTVWNGSYPAAVISRDVSDMGADGNPLHGTICQYVEDVRLANLSLEGTGTSVWVESIAYTTYVSGSSSSMRHCFLRGNSYAMDTYSSGGFACELVGCVAEGPAFFLCSGIVRDCVAGYASFDGSGAHFINCTGGSDSFRGLDGGTAIGCVGGNGSFDSYGSADSTFKDCVGGDFSFVHDDLGQSVITEGCMAGEESFTTGYFCEYGNFEYVDCVGGVCSFLGYAVFARCIGGDCAFSFSRGNFVECEAGQWSFDSSVGSFVDCRAGDSGFYFGPGLYNLYGGSYTRCDGGDNSFSLGHQPDLLENSQFVECTVGAESFGFNSVLYGFIDKMPGQFLNCTSTSDNAFGGYDYNAGELFTNWDRQELGQVFLPPQSDLSMGDFTSQ